MEGDNRKKKKLLTYNENYPRPMPRALTQRRGTALTELEEVGGVRLMWCVAAALKNEIVSKEKQKKKNTYAAGARTMGAKGRDNTAEYLEKTLARRKKLRR